MTADRSRKKNVVIKQSQYQVFQTAKKISNMYLKFIQKGMTKMDCVTLQGRG